MTQSYKKKIIGPKYCKLMEDLQLGVVYTATARLHNNYLHKYDRPTLLQYETDTGKLGLSLSYNTKKV